MVDLNGHEAGNGGHSQRKLSLTGSPLHKSREAGEPEEMAARHPDYDKQRTSAIAGVKIVRANEFSG